MTNRIWLDEDGGAADRSACAEVQSVDGASAASALGSTQSYCFTSSTDLALGASADKRRARWAARAMLWQASSLKAVRCCGRMLHNDAIGDPDDGQAVVINRREVNGRPIAGYQGLMTCGSVWSCPRCSAVIAHTRAAEIAAAVRECDRQGGKVYLLTLTMRHTSKDRLAQLWEGLSTGWRSAFGTRQWTGQRARTVERGGKTTFVKGHLGDAELFDVAGMTRVVEATYGAPALGGNGWHLHIHALVFTASEMEGALMPEMPVWAGSIDREWFARNIFAARVHARWSAGLNKAGFQAPGSVAVDIRDVTVDGADYLGGYLSKATYDAATKLGVEVADGQQYKTGRIVRNRTPFEILAELASSVDARGFGVRTPRHWEVVESGQGDWAVIDKDTGEVLAVTPPGEWAVWHEWEQASKGRRQLLWSRRRKDPVSVRDALWNVLLEARGTTAEESDGEVAVAEVEGETVAEIGRTDWYRILVWRPELMATLLEIAERGTTVQMAEALASAGISVRCIGHVPTARSNTAQPLSRLRGELSHSKRGRSPGPAGRHLCVSDRRVTGR